MTCFFGRIYERRSSTNPNGHAQAQGVRPKNTAVSKIIPIASKGKTPNASDVKRMSYAPATVV